MEPATTNDLIEYFSTNFQKVLASKGPTHHYTTYAFLQLQAAKMGKPMSEIGKWAKAEQQRWHNMELDAL